jgi:N-dimethylarginine dimethylaminohydrolase
MIVFRKLPNSFSKAISKSGATIDASIAQAQHDAYTELLSNAFSGENVILPTIESFPDCCFGKTLYYYCYDYNFVLLYAFV